LYETIYLVLLAILGKIPILLGIIINELLCSILPITEKLENRIEDGQLVKSEENKFHADKFSS